MQHFTKKRYFKNKASVALNPLISLIGRLLRVAAENVVTDRQTDRQNDKPSTVTLAAHTRRWLINTATGYITQVCCVAGVNVMTICLSWPLR